MKIVERYTKRMRMFMGRGGWAALGPIRFVLSLFHRLYAASSGKSQVQYAVSGPKVISVGNIEVGGSGKTPCVLAITSALRERGFRPAVVSRGYGGKAGIQGGALILPEGGQGAKRTPRGYLVHSGVGEEEAALEFGDEAILYIKAGLPLAVDRLRERGIEAVVEAVEPTHVLLDDAFHRTSIQKDLDILLLDSEKPFGNGWLLPYGTLRELPSSVSRAGAVIFTRSRTSSIPAEAKEFVMGKKVFFANHCFSGLFDSDGSEVKAGDIIGMEVSLLSGIARPESFEATAIGCGLNPEVSFRFDDHHRYNPAEIESVIKEAAPGSVFVTTAKDWSKAAVLFPAGTRVLRLEMVMEIEGIEDLLEPVL
jgi:tetraacyldisaccharide 4'-kinase